MSALADALVAAQSRAVAALGKQYVGGQMDEDELRVADSERAYVVGKLGEDGLVRLFGATR